VGNRFGSGEYKRWRPVGNRFRLRELLSETCGSQVCSGRVVVGDLWATGLDQGSCRWRPVGCRFGSGELLLETCGQQVRIRRVVVGDLWATGLDRESCRWRPVGGRFRS
jgi:hypothetical protein